MASSSTIFPKSAIPSPTIPPKRRPKTTRDPFSTQPARDQQRRRKCPAIAAAAASSSAIALPINVDYLENEFSGRGVSFEGLGDGCVVKLALDNGSAAKLMLPSGLVTSYKPFMWHGATYEVLHTTVSEGMEGEAVIHGGVSNAFRIEGACGLPWSPRTWSLQAIRGSPDKSFQVELVSRASDSVMEANLQVTLESDLLGSELTFVNPSSSAVELSGSFMTHLKVSTPDATYVAGLQGSNYHNKNPFSSEFSIIPPDFVRKVSLASTLSWPQTALQYLFSSSEGADGKFDKGREDPDVEMEGEEDDDYAQLTEKMSRIYTNAPRNFTIIDRGRRNSIIVSRSGLDEFYILSPGSRYQWYGKYAYICIGPSALLTPVAVGPGCVWRGAHYIHNPNL